MVKPTWSFRITASSNNMPFIIVFKKLFYLYEAVTESKVKTVSVNCLIRCRSEVTEIEKLES